MRSQKQTKNNPIVARTTNRDTPGAVMCTRIRVLLLLLVLGACSVVEASPFLLRGVLASAGIFGGSNSGTSPSKQPPPPPPPRKNSTQILQQQPQPFPPYGTPLDASTSSYYYGGSTDTHQQREPPPPPFADSDVFYLQRDLDLALQREQHWYDQLQNATSALQGFANRETLHTHQLNVLTERVMETENALASQHNQVVELEANCTELARQLSDSQAAAEEATQRCQEWKAQYTTLQEQLHEYETKYQTAQREAHDLAARIERHRLLEEAGETVRKKRTGFWGWLFGGSGGPHETELHMLQETARSTLLSALQAERESVSELEQHLTLLQQNNSAISEQLMSRDGIIDELNDRVAVFEEDKLVLKAALRQLKKEMSEEAPKTHQLTEDLKFSQTEVERLNNEIHNLMESHQNQIQALQGVLQSKQDEIATTESNLTVIGTYVDKLEERLADFTVARRDIEQRERACKAAEAKAEQSGKEALRLQAKTEALEQEHEDLKVLLSQLASERAKLQKEKIQQSRQVQSLENDVKSLRQSYAKLDNDGRSLRALNEDLEMRIAATEKQLNSTLLENRRYSEQLEVIEMERSQLVEKMEGASTSQQTQSDLLQDASRKQAELEAQIASLKSERNLNVEQFQSQLQEYQQQIHSLEQQKMQALQAAQTTADKALELEKLKAAEEAKRQDLERRLSQTSQRVEVLQNEMSRSRLTDTRKQEASTEQQRPAPHAFQTPTKDVVPSRGVKSQVGPATKPAVVVSMAKPNRVATGNTTSPAINATNKAYLPRGGPRRQFGQSAVAPNRTLQVTAPRKVRFRGFRKFLSKRTGLHGLITKPSQHRPDKRKQPPQPVSKQQQRGQQRRPQEKQPRPQRSQPQRRPEPGSPQQQLQQGKQRPQQQSNQPPASTNTTRIPQQQQVVPAASKPVTPSQPRRRTFGGGTIP